MNLNNHIIWDMHDIQTSILVIHQNEAKLYTSHFHLNEEKWAYEWVDILSTTCSPVIASGSKMRIPLSAPRLRTYSGVFLLQSNLHSNLVEKSRNIDIIKPSIYR